MSIMTLQDSITALCVRAGYSPSQLDFTGMAGSTAVIRGLIVGQLSSTRSVLDIIRNCYFIDCVLSDKLYFFEMGGASVATIPYKDLGADGGTPFALVDSSELEVYAQFSLTYSNVNNGHQPDTQLSDRLLSGQFSVNETSVPLDFTAEEGKIIVDTQLMLQAIGMRRATIAVGRKYYYVQAGDPITIIGHDGSTYRFRVAKISASGGIYKMEIVIDDVSAYLQAGITSDAVPGQTEILGVSNTVLVPLDPPLLSEDYDKPGYYGAVEGESTSWRSAGLYDSIDDVTYNPRAVYSNEATIGIASNVLGNWTGGNVIDFTNTLTVDIGSKGSLSSTTVSNLFKSLSLNLIMVGTELIQFVTATLTSPGIYVLSGLLRGRRGTEASISTHAPDEFVVLLNTSGLKFVPLQVSELGIRRYLKPVSNGQKIATVDAQEFTPRGIALKPFAPINLRASRVTTDTLLYWERRTRYSSRITGPLAWSCPLGETEESYVIEIYDAGFTILKRTLTSSVASVVYSSANQVTDFGSNQSIIYAKVYQISSVVGRGYPLTSST